MKVIHFNILLSLRASYFHRYRSLWSALRFRT